MKIRRVMLLIIDLAIGMMCFYGAAYVFHGDVMSLAITSEYSLVNLLAILFLLSVARFLGGVYKVVWRYANVNTYLCLILSDFLAGVVYTSVSRLVQWGKMPFSMALAYFLLVLLMTLCSRFVYQAYYAHVSRIRDEGRKGRSHKIPIGIVGAGNVGASLVEELIRNPRSQYYPVCFFDTDSGKAGNSINGLPIYRADENTVEFIKKNLHIQEIVIAIPNAGQARKRELYDFYQQSGCKIKIYDYPLQGNALAQEGKRGLRDFQIEDLLFRDPIKVRSKETKAFYHNKTVLITGGGGSIGSELCRQIAKQQPKKLVIVDIYENNAYDIQQELIGKYGDQLDLEVYIGSVRDVQRMEQVFRQVRPELVFHAAAHKHVPLMQISGCEAIKNNVLGTYNVANLAEKYGVKKFLLISTDKAVNPTNIMGASKRLCEMVIQCRRDSETEFTAVRFGNVLGSNGSVIPIFKRQIAAGGPITLTDKRIIRYFMTIPEAVGLVMETCCMAKNGELFVLDMGKPVKILDLAENMIKLSGLVPYKDIDIVEVGLRPGEKLYEELLMKTEQMEKTDNALIFIEKDQCLSRQEMEQKLEILREAVREESSVLDAIKATVPTYHDPEELNRVAAQAEEMKNARCTSVATNV